MTGVMHQALALFSFSGPRPDVSRSPVAEDPAPDCRNRRDFVADVLTHCPEALESDYGVGMMMELYHRDF